MSIKVEEFVAHFFVMCDDQSSFAADKCVVYIEDDAMSVAVSLEVGGGNIITYA